MAQGVLRILIFSLVGRKMEMVAGGTKKEAARFESSKKGLLQKGCRGTFSRALELNFLSVTTCDKLEKREMSFANIIYIC
jgi:hypothetical protein